MADKERLTNLVLYSKNFQTKVLKQYAHGKILNTYSLPRSRTHQQNTTIIIDMCIKTDLKYLGSLCYFIPPLDGYSTASLLHVYIYTLKLLRILTFNVYLQI